MALTVLRRGRAKGGVAPLLRRHWGRAAFVAAGGAAFALAALALVVRAGIVAFTPPEAPLPSRTWGAHSPARDPGLYALSLAVGSAGALAALAGWVPAAARRRRPPLAPVVPLWLGAFAVFLDPAARWTVLLAAVLATAAAAVWESRRPSARPPTDAACLVAAAGAVVACFLTVWARSASLSPGFWPLVAAALVWAAWRVAAHRTARDGVSLDSSSRALALGLVPSFFLSLFVLAFAWPAAGGLLAAGVVAATAATVTLAWRRLLRGARPSRAHVRNALVWVAAPALLVLYAQDVRLSWALRGEVEDARLLAYGETLDSDEGAVLETTLRSWRGEVAGRDYVLVYGPLGMSGAVATWKVVGPSVASFLFHQHLMRVVGLVGIWLLAALVLKRPIAQAAAVAVLFEGQAHLTLLSRMGTALGVVALGLVAARARSLWPSLACGVAWAAAALVSHELAAASALSLLAAFWLVRPAGGPVRGRRLAALAAGALVVLVPVGAYYASRGALGAVWRDLTGHPGYFLRGYAEVPYPGLTETLAGSRPLVPSSLADQLLDVRRTDTLATRFVLPALSGLVLLLALVRLARAQPLATREAAAAVVAGFGLLAFLPALGRSDAPHIRYGTAPALLLFFLVLERALAGWRRQRRPALGGLLAAALVLFAAQVVVGPALLRAADRVHATLARSDPARLWRELKALPLPEDELAAARYVRERTRPDEAVLAVPNAPALYFLLDRPNPTRYSQFLQLAAPEQRKEAVAALAARPPRYVVYEIGGRAFDRIPDQVMFPEVLAFLAPRYHVEAAIGRFLVLAPGAPREPASAPLRSTEWSFASGELQGWQPARGLEVLDAPGGLHLVAKTPRAALVSPTLDEDVRRVAVTLTSDRPGHLLLYWTGPDGGVEGAGVAAVTPGEPPRAYVMETAHASVPGWGHPRGPMRSIRLEWGGPPARLVVHHVVVESADPESSGGGT